MISLNQLFNILIPIVTMPYLSRVLGANSIGYFSFENSVVYYFTIFILLGINNYGSRTISEFRDEKNRLLVTVKELYCMQLILGCGVMLIFLLFCIMTAGNNILRWLMLISIVSTILDINWIYVGMEKFGFVVLRNVLIKLSTTISIFIFVKNETDIFIYALIMCFSSLLSSIALWPEFYNILKQKTNCKLNITQHFKPNLLLFIPIVAISLYKYIDKIMLGIICSREDVAYYDYSEKLTIIPLALVNSLGMVMLPRMTYLVSKKAKDMESKYFYNSVFIAILLSSLLSFGLMGIANQFIILFYGSKFEACIQLSYYLLPCCIFVSIASVLRTQFLIPHKKDKVYVISVIVGALVNVFANIFLIPLMKAEGAALGTIFAEISVCLAQYYLVRKIVNIRKVLYISFPWVFFGIIMFLILLNIPVLTSNQLANVFLKILCGAILFTLFVLIFISSKLYNKFIEQTECFDIKKIIHEKLNGSTFVS